MSKNKDLEEYQDSAGYIGYEDKTPVGRKALKAYNKAEKNDFESIGNVRVSKSGKKAAQEVVKKDREQIKPFERVDEMGNAYKKGGSVGSASRRADGIATKGKTKGRFI